MERGFNIACDDFKPARRLVVYAGQERVLLPHGVEAIGLFELAEELASMT